MSAFTHLHVHSTFSPQWGVCSLDEICGAARSMGMTRLALTDRNGLYGIPHFLETARETGIAPIIGAEAVTLEHRAVLLARDETGYAHLSHLLSELHCRNGFDLPSMLGNYRQGLIILSDGQTVLSPLRRQSPEGLFVELSPGHQIHQALALSRELRLPPVATSRAVLLKPDDFELHRVLRAIALNTKLSRLQPEETAKEGDLLLSPARLADFFPHCPEALENTDRIAEACKTDWDFSETIFPAFRGMAEEEAFAELSRRARQGALWRYGGIDEAVEARLQKELTLIHDKGFAHYFLVVEEIARQSPRTCGRGSAAASLVAYCLGITHVDPIRHNLFFERFLNPGRRDPPDIDIDFAWDERDEVLADILGDHAGQAAMVCNHIRFQPRMAIRETAKVFGLPEGEIARLTRRLPWLSRGDGDGLQERLQGLPSLADQDFSAPWPAILRLATRLIGLPRHLSVHSGGVIITPGPITDYVPIEYAVKKMPIRVPIIQWDKDGAEEAGLVKIDILGNRSLGVIRDCIAAVRQGGTPLAESGWNPEDDRPTREAVASGRTMGCFYIESPAMRLLERKAGSGDFEQLVIQSSIIRPAANEFVREYVRRLHGGSWQPLHPAVGDILDETYGLMVYQEDVSRVAVALAGFSHADADGLRKVMAKKDKVLQLQDYHRRFHDGCRRRGVAEADIDPVWRMMLSFDGYSFCKPHSASYARVSFQAAYLKRHHPAEFMAAVISNQGGYYSTFAYVSEAKRLGLTVLPPDVNAGDRRWQGRPGSLRVGLQSVAGLSAACLDRLLVARQQGKFVAAVDFWHRVRPADDEARALIHAGAMDSLDPGGNRTALLWQWAVFLRLRETAKAASLFPAVLPEPPPLPPPDRTTLLRREYAVLGFLCSDHPVTLIGRVPPGLVKVARLGECVNRRVRCAVWLLTGKLVATKSGEAMEFLTFEDETGIVEATFFPPVYRRCAHLLQSGRAYVLAGTVEQDYGAITLTVEQAEALGTGG